MRRSLPLPLFMLLIVRLFVVSLALWVWLVPDEALLAQQAPGSPEPARAATPPVEAWTGKVSAGLSLTSGNSDTLNYNLAFDFTRGRDTGHLFRATGLYLRGRQNELVIANRTSLGLRDRYDFSPRGFVFGQLDYLRDTFKRIDYLLAPTAGVGLTIVDTEATTFAVDAGIGAVWEKNPERDLRSDAAVSAAAKLERKLTETAAFKHAINALWKAADPSDGLYTVSLGLSTKIHEQLQLSIDILDTFKNKPPTADTRKNDVALVTGITATF